MTSSEILSETSDQNDQIAARVCGRGVSFRVLCQQLIVMQDWKTISNCLDRFVIENAIEKHQVQVSEEEQKAEIMSFRKKHHLLTADDTRKWLDEMHMTDDHFLEACFFQARLQKLKRLLFEHRMQEFFVFKQHELVKLDLYKIAVSGEETAREIVSLLAEGASFFDYAHKYSTDLETSKSCGYLGKVRLLELEPRLQELLSKSSAGDIVGPLKMHKNFEIYYVDCIEPAVLNEELASELEDILFKQWLAAARNQSGIELFI